MYVHPLCVVFDPGIIGISLKTPPWLLTSPNNAVYLEVQYTVYLEVQYTLYLEVYSTLCTWKCSVHCVLGSAQYTVYLELHRKLCTWK